MDMQARTDQVMDKLADVGLLTFLPGPDALGVLWTMDFMLAVTAFIGDCLESEVMPQSEEALMELHVNLMQMWIESTYDHDGEGPEEDNYG